MGVASLCRKVELWVAYVQAETLCSDRRQFNAAIEYAVERRWDVLATGKLDMEISGIPILLRFGQWQARPEAPLTLLLVPRRRRRQWTDERLGKLLAKLGFEAVAGGRLRVVYQAAGRNPVVSDGYAAESALDLIPKLRARGFACHVGVYHGEHLVG